MQIKSIITIAMSAFLLFSCGSDETVEEVNIRNEQEILDYLSDNNITADKTSSGLYVRVLEEGSIEKPSLTDTVTVLYKGYLDNDNVFDESTQPISFPLNRVILGWQEGIQFFGRGGSGNLYIPSRLAYGSNPPSPSIPENAILIFDVEVIDFF